MMESTIDGRLEELRSMVLELREIVLRQNDEMRRELRELAFSRSVAGTAEDPATASYQVAIRRIRELVSAALPREATVAVVSRGDDQLLELYGRRGWHFPRMDDGTYAGYHPADSHAAIAHLEASRQKGAEYLLVPRTAFWWFDHYPALHRHLERRYDAVLEADECTIYSLRARPVPGDAQGARPLAELVDRAAHRLGRAPAVLDLTPGSSLAGTLTDRTVFTPPSRELPLPYLDRTIDLVVVGEGDEALLAEAWRVAETAVVELRDHGGKTPQATIRWRSAEPGPAPPTVSIIVQCEDPAAVGPVLAAARESLPEEHLCELIVASAGADGLNAAAGEAAGELLVFLRDAAPIAGWLPPLLDLLRDGLDVGAVVGKVVHPDGRLREAGAVFLSDGTLTSIGHGETEVGSPLYNHVREVDGCSGGALATRRELFLRFGGFRDDPELGSLAIADYCLSMREGGHRVLYQPESTLIHHGAPGARGEGSVRAPLAFRRKWGGRLRNQALAAGWFDLPALRPPAAGAANGADGGDRI